MKAYVVKFKGQEWCDFTHAETAQEARKLFWRAWAYEGGDFIDVRATRIPELDDKPLVSKNISEIYGFQEWDSSTDTCKCELCTRKETHT
jgi:hypothetical protein